MRVDRLYASNGGVTQTNNIMHSSADQCASSIDLIQSVATMVAAMNRVRSDSTNQMQENILYLCLLGSWIEVPLRIFLKAKNIHFRPKASAHRYRLPHIDTDVGKR